MTTLYIRVDDEYFVRFRADKPRVDVLGQPLPLDPPPDPSSITLCRGSADDHVEIISEPWDMRRDSPKAYHPNGWLDLAKSFAKRVAG